MRGGNSFVHFSCGGRSWVRLCRFVSGLRARALANDGRRHDERGERWERHGKILQDKKPLTILCASGGVKGGIVGKWPGIFTARLGDGTTVAMGGSEAISRDKIDV